jgi:Zn-dependent protease with chaperone function
MSLVYPKERPLFQLSLVFSALVWLGLVIGTMGSFLVFFGLGCVGYLFTQSAFVSYVRGTAIRVGADQLPDLHRRFLECCERIGVGERPEVYVLNAHGILNALATRFLRRHYVVLFSDVVDAFAEHPESLDFYIGHELGHIHRGHLRWSWFLWPAALLPLIGAAYSRAREYTCDLYGLACCDVPKDAAYGLAVLAAGPRSWDKIDLVRYARQSEQTGGFWMAYHELCADYPWLTKRMRHVLGAASGAPAQFPSRNPIAWLLAMLTPRGFGGGGAIGALMLAIGFAGVVAAIAIPNFLRFQQRAQLAPVSDLRRQVLEAAEAHVAATGALPSSADELGLAETSNAGVASIAIDGERIVLFLAPELSAIGSQLVLTPMVENDTLAWSCEGDLDPALLPVACGQATDAASLAAELQQAMAAAGTAAPDELFADDVTCSEAFRASAEYAALGTETRAALLAGCNQWKLEQLDAAGVVEE